MEKADLRLDFGVAENYHSNTQRARVVTEHWLNQHMFCPICGAEHLAQFAANRPVADFLCEHCKQQFELKSREAKKPEGSIQDGAYKTMIQRITSNDNPNLFYLTHNEEVINHLLLIPRYFFTPSIIEKRTPLKETARRSGWTGCKINLATIPREGMIYVIKSGIVMDKSLVIEEYNRVKCLQLDNIESRGWLMDTLFCLNQIEERTFTLRQMYEFEPYLQAKHPDNRNVQAKIRQQLQVLRNMGYLHFLSRGVYQKEL
jgi:type II restriction enzyme